MCASEAACKPSSVPRRTATTVIHLGRRSPDGSCSRPEGWAARLSPRRTGVAPSYLALLRVEFAAFHSGPEGPASSLWHWSSPLGGRALPATLRCGARTFLTPAGCPASARPSGRLAGPRIVGHGRGSPQRRPGERRTRLRPSGPRDARRSARRHPVERLVGQPVGRRVLGPRHVGRRPALEARQRRLRLGPQRLQLRVLDPPPAVELLHDQLRVEEQVDLLRARAAGRARAPAAPRSTRRRCWSGRPAPPRSSRRERPTGSRASAREPSISAAPSDAGPGLPRAAPSVRITRCG